MRYEEPSIVEALCEFLFTPNSQWDLTVFGRFADELSTPLPVREQGEVQALKVTEGPGEVRHEIRREPRMRFFNEKRTLLAQAGPNMVAANVLPPYPHWPPFRDFIKEVFQAYVRAAAPKGLQRMTLRYLDRVVVPDEAFELGDWIDKASPYIPAFIHDASGRAFGRVQKDVGDGLDTLTLQVESGEQAIITLDTELTVLALPLDINAVAARLDALHERITEIFEACISDRLRRHLRPEASR